MNNVKGFTLVELMIVVAYIGLAANIAGTLLLISGSKNSINIRSVYLHLLSDAVSSFGVILGGIFIYFYKIYWLDPVLTVLISIYIIKESWEIVREALSVLMMSAPDSISINEIEDELMSIEGIKNIHHVHLWRINERDIHFEAHAKVEDTLVSNTEQLIEKIEAHVHEKFNINHVKLQFECDRCGMDEVIKL